MTRTLVTMALPYANGSLHLGHMVEAVQTDVYVRALRAMTGKPYEEAKKEIVFICAADMHGTPIEVNARKAGKDPEQFAESFREEHERDYKAFGIDHNIYYKTHSPENERQVLQIYKALEDGGHIHKKDVEQFYCEVDKRFLPDRFVKGTCPKCGAPDQYGDACEKCGSTYEPTDLKDPKCALCGTPPVRRASAHYFVKLSEFKSFLEKWVAEGDHLQPEIRNFDQSWIAEGLKDWDISRDVPYFGFKIPGESEKYFYVWVDAPVGYLSSTEKWATDNGLDYKLWWGRDADARLEHFIGKDIIYFHTLFWPAMLHAGGWKVPDRVHVHGFLGVEGEKMSKSRGTFINARQYLDAGLDPEWLRYFYAANLGPSPSDIDLSFSELKNRVNGELLNNIGNLANRALKLIWDRFEGKLSTAGRDWYGGMKEFEKKVIEPGYRNCDTRAVIQFALARASQANETLQQQQPWKLVSTNPEEAQRLLTWAVNWARICIRWIAPMVPKFAKEFEAQLGAPLGWGDFTPIENHKINQPSPLVRKVEDGDLKKLTDSFRPKESAPPTQPQAASREPQAEAAPAPITIDQFATIDLRAGKVLACEKVPKKDKLLKLTIDLGEPTPRTIASGVALSYKPEELIGKTVCVVANLPPRDFGKGLVSHGMVLYSTGGARENTAVELPADVKPGSKVK